MMDNHWQGLLPQVYNAKAAGATEEEIMEVAAVMAYAKAKMNMVDTCAAMTEAFANPAFKSIIRLTE